MVDVVRGDLSSNTLVNAVMMDKQWHWTDLPTYGLSQPVLTYFLDGSGTGGAWDGNEVYLMNRVFDSLSAVINVRFEQVYRYEDAQLVERKQTDDFWEKDPPIAEHDPPQAFLGWFEDDQIVGDFNVNDPSWINGMSVGGDAYYTMLHEVMHGLGLDHVGSASAPGRYNLDQSMYTVMSINTPWSANGPVLFPSANQQLGGALGPSAIDIAALQYLYGANTHYHEGQDTYILPDNDQSGPLQTSTGFLTIWDTGGIDEIVYNGSRNTVIDLNAASLADAPDGGGAISNATGVHGGFTIANGVEIENARGGSGRDEILGNHLSNLLDGGEGIDKLFGGGGVDYLVGGAGNDTLNGGAGDDDFMYGGTGNDEYAVDDPGDVVKEEAGDAGGTRDKIFTTLNTYYLGAEDKGWWVEELQYVGGGSFEGHGNNLNNIIVAATGNDWLYGHEGKDSLFGGRGSDHLYGGIENDELNGEEGIDFLYGEAGNDVLDGGTGDDWMRGGADSDTYIVDSLNDHVIEVEAPDLGPYQIAMYEIDSGGIDTVRSSVSGFILPEGVENLVLTGGARHGYGNSLANVMTGNDQADTLRGMDGADTLAGGLGSDSIYGGTGNDTIEVLRIGQDTVYGGEDSDTLAFDDADAGVNVNLASGSATFKNGSTVVGSVTFSEMENLTGSKFADTLTGDKNNNVLAGGAGNDTIKGMAGDDTIVVSRFDSDTIDGGADNDTLFFLETADASLMFGMMTVGATLDLAKTSQTFDLYGIPLGTLTYTGIENLTGNYGDDRFSGNALSNVLSGNGGNDVLDGREGKDTLDGGQGFDTITGGAGNDTLTGGTEADTFVYAKGWGKDTITDFAVGVDHLDMSGVSGLTSLGQLAITDTAAGARVGFGGDAITLNGVTASQLTASSFLFVAGQHLVGTAGADTLTGGAGNDRIEGGDGNDILIGEAGADQLIGGAGTDFLYIDDKDTVVDGGEGFDYLYLEYTNPQAIGSHFTVAGTNVEYVGGSLGSDVIDASGVNYDTVLFGNLGNDTLIGGSANDWLWGSVGNDTLTGGSGRDTFYFAVSDTDTITDFTYGQDVLDMTGVTGLNSMAQLTITDTAQGARIVFGTDTITLNGVTKAQLESSNSFIFAKPTAGTEGKDVLTGDGAANHLMGLGGDDVLSGLDGADILDGGTGIDTADYSASAASVSVNLATGTGQGGDAEGDTFIGIEHAIGSAFGDRFRGGTDRGQFLAGDGNDTMIGGSWYDWFEGGNGNDIFIGTGGQMVMLAGDGDDTMTGSLDNGNYFDGGTGNDVMVGGNLGDYIADMTGGDDTMHGGGGADTLDDFYGLTQLFGEDGDDFVSAAGGSGVLDGGEGKDYISVANGNYTLVGGAGDDTLEAAGTGAHIFTGGAGADTFTYRVGGDQMRIVTDFQDGVDHIHLWDNHYYGNVPLESLAIADSAAGAVISWNGASQMVLTGITASQLTHDDFVL